MSEDLITEKENLRKIDITLTESSDRSESTSSEVHTENLNSDYEGNGKLILCVRSLILIFFIKFTDLLSQ